MNNKKNNISEQNIFVLGLDPVFLDIILTPFDENNKKLENLLLGSDHITNNDIKLIPGGNGLNVAKILCKLKNDVYFIGKINQFFEELMLISVPDIKIISVLKKEPNYTVALQLLNNETQFNCINEGFSLHDLTKEGLLLLILSKLIPFSNIGLNFSAKQLFEYICDYFNTLNLKQAEIMHFISLEKNISGLIDFILKFSYFKPKDKNNIISSKYYNTIKEKLPIELLNLGKKVFFFDPSTLVGFNDFSWLNTFFKVKLAKLPGFKIISLNTYEFSKLAQNNIEFNLFLKNDNNFIIKHDKKMITIFKSSLNDYIEFSVPKIETHEIVTTVGAGDAFNAGFLHKFCLTFNLEKSILFGIEIAQKHIKNSF